MPTQFSSLDTGFPAFNGAKSTEQKVNELHNFTYMLLESLRYILRNIGPENLNTTEMDGYVEEFTEPLRVQITDEDGNWTVLTLQSDGLHVGNAAGTTTISGDCITSRTITGEKIVAEAELSAPVITGGTITGAKLVSSDGGQHGQFLESEVEIVDGSVRLKYGGSNYAESTLGDNMGNWYMRANSGYNIVLTIGGWDAAYANGSIVFDGGIKLKREKNYGSLAERDAIVSPEEGYLFFVLDAQSGGPYIYSGSTWVPAFPTPSP